MEQLKLNTIFNKAEVWDVTGAPEEKPSPEATVAAHTRKWRNGSIADVIPENLMVT